MSQPKQRHEIATKPLVYRIPGMDSVTVRRDIVYHSPDTGALTMDIYYPPDHKSGTRIPAVVFALGLSDLGAEAMLGCKFKEGEAYIGWARLAAASGLAAIIYTNRQPAADLQALLRYVRENAAELGTDQNRTAMWCCSAHGPVALSVLMQPEFRKDLKCAALYYPFTMDLDGSTGVAEFFQKWGMSDPNAGKAVRDLPQDLPLFVARAGKDETPRLNETLDRFLSHALAGNLPLTMANHATGPHAFDLLDDSETSREIIRLALRFLQFHLRVESR